ncbi:MAG: alpha/beta fold hydrolase [Simkaniaceae bacterium]|nr:alpha/beta fold hydrolase [Candidatus Sacchlamyda saccharinae]
MRKILLYLLLLTHALVANKPYATEDVFFENGAITLAGTLTIPTEKKPTYVALLVSGFGPNDRDQHIYGHKTLLVLADHLAKHGIASLRYDKRGIGKSTGQYQLATTKDFADDALAGVQYLTKKFPKVGLIGHSEGGAIATVVAAKSQDIAFVVSMAGPAVSGEEVLYEQGRLLQKAIGIDQQKIEEDRKLREEMFAVVKSESDFQVIEQKLKLLTTKHFSSPRHASTQANEGLAVLHPGNVDLTIRQICSPWFRYFLTFDSSEYLKDVEAPFLALGAEKDLQVPPHQSLPAVAKTLHAAKKTNYEVKKLPHLNHLFQTCQTGAISEYSKIEETIAPSALQAITDWISVNPASST